MNLESELSDFVQKKAKNEIGFLADSAPNLPLPSAQPSLVSILIFCLIFSG